MICIVSNDSGRADLISSWTKTRKEDLFCFIWISYKNIQKKNSI